MTEDEKAALAMLVHEWLVEQMGVPLRDVIREFEGTRIIDGQTVEVEIEDVTAAVKHLRMTGGAIESGEFFFGVV